MSGNMTGTEYGGQPNRVLPNTKADGLSGATRQITELHRHIHEAKAFEIYKSVADLADSAHTYFEIITPENESLHLKEMQLWISEGPVIIKLIAEPTLTTGATPFVPVNLNDNLKDGAIILSDAVVKVNPTGISGGRELKAWRFGINGQGSQANDSLISTQRERVLRLGGVTYLLDVQNISGGAIDLSLDAVWYE